MRIAIAAAHAALAALTSTALGAQSIVINEVMPDPISVTDSNGEWFELFNTAGSAINIQNWRVTSGAESFTITSSVSVPAGGYVVLARNGTTATNGGVTVAFAYGGAVTLANTSDALTLINAAGATIDNVSWTSTTPGRSWSLRNAWVAHGTISAGAVWQLATSAYGLGNLGTPRARNDGFISQPVAELVVRVLDIGQGDATYISNGTSKVIIDGGPSTARFGFLLDSLGLNNQTINAVILSHAHLDHLAGLQELFRTSRHIVINVFFENRDASTGLTLAKLRDSINDRVARGEMILRDTDDPCANGSPTCTITLNGGARLIVLRPKPTDGNPNNRSVAVKLLGPDAASFSMWFAGDAERAEIAWFMGTAGYNTNPGMQVKVLKANHHGSCNGITKAYLSTVNPDRVAASVASPNGFKHMHTQTKALLTTKTKPWYRTDRNGTIVYRTPGTAGGGYTTKVLRGTTNMGGTSDANSTATECNPIP